MDSEVSGTTPFPETRGSNSVQYGPLGRVLEVCQSGCVVTVIAGSGRHFMGRGRGASRPAVHPGTARRRIQTPLDVSVGEKLVY